MYRSARPERRKAVAGMLMSMALTAFLTGVTEPIEFSFLFLAPLLFAFHAVLTGAAMALMHVLGVRLGFGFSAGVFDYVLNFSKATRPLLLFPVGALYALLYYGIFRFAIVRFDLKTPGREDEPVGEEIGDAPAAGSRGDQFLEALGGASNLGSIDACTTRLRLVVKDQSRVMEGRLRALGAHGFVRPSANGLQVVLGPIADAVAMEMREAAGELSSLPEEKGSRAGPAPEGDAAPWHEALGGKDNLVESGGATSRLWLHLKDPARIDEKKLSDLGVRMIARAGNTNVQLLTDDAAAIAALLQSV
jgi:PTS system N-acetylglucosamine-specific IIC component